MAKVEPLTATIDLGHRFVEAIVAHDWKAVAACFEPSAEFRAVVPNVQRPFREYVGGDAAAAQIQRWFGDADVTELVEGGVEQIADRVRITYRIHEHEADGWYDVEQVAFVTPGKAGFERMNLVCSGFRPAG